MEIVEEVGLIGALLVKGPDSSLGEVHRGSCFEHIHMEEENVEVKVQEDEVEDGRETNEECKVEVEERSNTQAHDTWMR